jgi:oxygen-dependent protoporphyrinogen oxidase
MESTHTSDVIIVGGGITGMAAAYQLQKETTAAGRPLSYTLLESSPALGGKITTDYVDGFTIEGGPDCFISQKPWAADLCRELGIGDELIGTNDERRKTFVLNHGRLTPLPDGVMLIVPTRITPFVTSTLISWPGKIRMGMDFFIPRRKDESDESVAAFVRRRLGREALDKIAEPLMGGIHVSDPEDQSLLGTFPRFRDLEMKHGSLIRGMLASRRKPSSNGHVHATGSAQPARPSSLFMSLRGGLAEMVHTLAAALTGEIVTHAPATEIIALPNRGATGPRYQVRTADGRTFAARAIILAGPAYVSGELVGGIDPALSTALNSIRYVTTGTVSLGYRLADLGRPLNGFGFVVPRAENRRISACTFSSTKFDYRAPEAGVLMRCFVGGPGKEHMVDLDDADLLAAVRDELAQIMGVRAEPVVTRIFRWRNANAQYDVGHLDRVKAMKAMAAQHPGLRFAGSAFDGVGVPDCVRQGREAARQTAKDLA